MSISTENRLAFRPTVGEARLEERLVLSSIKAAIVAPLQVQAAASSNMTVGQIHNAYLRQYHTAIQDLRSQINTRISQLYHDGRPTAAQLSDFKRLVEGAVNATALRVSSQAALLPNAANGLVTKIQNSLLGDNAQSLDSRLQTALGRSRNINAASTLKAAVANNLNLTAQAGSNQLNKFFNSTNLNQNQFMLDGTGQRIPLQQFIASGAINQFGNTLGALAQSFPTVANSTLFPDGSTTATTDARSAFANQASQALGLSAFLLDNNLALVSGASPNLTSQIQAGLFGTNTGTGTENTSLFNSIQNLPPFMLDFGTAAMTAFNNGFSNLASSLNTALGLPNQQNFNLPTGQIPSIFGSQFNTGFNNGFGSGFIGFGQSPADFNTNFSTGFNGLVSNTNTNHGFTLPTFGDGTPFNTGPFA